MYLYICIHIYTYIDKDTYISIDTDTYIYIHKHVIQIYTQVHIDTYIYIYIDIDTYSDISFKKTFCLMNIRPQDFLSHEPTLWFRRH